MALNTWLGKNGLERKPSGCAAWARSVVWGSISPERKIAGTANFARGQPGFAVIVAEVQKGEVCAGWIYDPLADVMVTAEAGGGAWS